MTNQEALELSIQHWEANVVAKTPDEASVSSEDCALCFEYYDPETELEGDCCRGCPVRKWTGEPFCRGTPYTTAEWTLSDWRDGIASHEAWQKAAQAELDFLKSLRESAPSAKISFSE